MSLKNTLF